MFRYSLIQTVAPAAEPVSLSEAKLWLRVEASVTEDDALIGSLITSARALLEEYTQRQFITATWELTLDAFPPVDVSIWEVGPRRIQQLIESGGQSAGEIRLPRPRFQSLTTFTYTDPSTGSTVTMDPAIYLVSGHLEPARITPTFGNVWPSTRNQVGSVKLVYQSGYGADGTYVPEPIRTAIKVAVAYWYRNREQVGDLPAGVLAMVNPYRLEEYQ